MKPLTIYDVTKNILTALDELDGEQLAEIHNKICSKKIKYKGDSLWQYTGEQD